MKISEIIEKLNAFHPPMEAPHTCDVVKCGAPEQECSGIVVCCFASYDVIKKAAELGANLVITHEPLFYDETDSGEWMGNDPVYAAKKKLIDEAGIVVYRDHDHIHASPADEGREAPDGIFYGIMEELGWKDYLIGDIKKPLLYKIPKQSAADLAQELMEKLNLTGIRTVGDMNTQVETVFFCQHITGGPGWRPGMEPPDREQIRKVNRYNADVIIPFEIVDWTLSAYVRDSAMAGMPKVIFEMGHFNTEELGMKCMAGWLEKAIGEKIPTTYVQSGDSFGYVLRK